MCFSELSSKKMYGKMFDVDDLKIDIQPLGIFRMFGFVKEAIAKER